MTILLECKFIIVNR